MNERINIMCLTDILYLILKNGKFDLILLFEFLAYILE